MRRGRGGCAGRLAQRCSLCISLIQKGKVQQKYAFKKETLGGRGPERIQ